MSIIAWNVRGLGNRDTVRALKEVIYKHNPCIVFLSETKKKRKYLEKLRTKNRFSGSYYVDPQGLAGGLALWWTADVQIGIIRESANFIDVSVSVSGEENWFCTFIYGPPYREEKHQFWETLSSLRSENFSRWCVLGDSNIVSNQSEKEGGNSVDNSQIGWFYEFLDSSRLLDLPIKGGTFTWSNMRCDDEAIVEKLDRILISNEWSLKFPKAIGILEAAIASDHNPIVLLLEGLKKRRKREFKFESRWLLEDDCSAEVREAWEYQNPCSGSNVLVKKLKSTRLRMSKWSREKFGNNRRSIEEIKKRILLLQSSPLSGSSKEEILALKHELHKLWESEERHWHQRARINWLKYGDKNTKFFHATTIQKQRQNAILKIKNDRGLWIEEEKDVYTHIVNHFKKIYSKDPSVNYDCIADLIPSCITEEINSSLSKEVTEEEIRKAVFGMGALKSPGPDGFSGIFYQTFWDIVKHDVISSVQNFFNNGFLDRELNKTNIVLIPKMKNPTEIGQFRPISLCNFSFKVISKIMASRLKVFLPMIIPPSQSAFVNGRLIHDNIILAHEAFHAIKSKRKGASGIMALKIDLEKAYDKVDWGVLEFIMTKMGFCKWWVERVRQCISTVSFSLVINGDRQKEFIPSRGLRQGEPLSPFLFLFVSNIFSWLLDRELRNDSFDGFRIGRRCPVISHLMFADDCVLFTKADEKNCDSIKRLLVMFQKATGQSVNCLKSSMFFSPNMSHNKKTNLLHILGFSLMEDGSKYLGLPSLWGRGKKEALSFIMEKIRQKLQSWKANLLSQGGKEVLIKAVATAIPSYIMQCFRLPSTFCDDLNSIISKFWWNGSNDKNRGIHWLSWNKVCKTKDLGGMGFRDLKSFNIALVAKQSWRIIKNPNSLLAQVLKGIYFPSGNIFLAPRGSNPSWAWTSIREGLALISEGSIWRVGNGKHTSIWEDRWVPSLPSRLIQSSKPHHCQDFLVSTLIDADNRTWRIEKLHKLFSEVEIKAIMSIPIGGPSVQDEFVWFYNTNGDYSVKSGYHVKRASEESVPCPSSSNDPSSDSALWRSVWNLRVPPKVKSFLWKACHDIIATKGNLFRRFHGHSSFGSTCPRCGDDFESTEHLFFFCPFAQAVWRASGFNYTPESRGFPGFSKWWKKISVLNAKGLFADGIHLIAFLCWHLWKSRNSLIFTAVSDDPIDVWIRTEEAFLEFSACSSPASESSISPPSTIPSWNPPSVGFVKVNCDASFDAGNGKACAACIIRNEKGQYVGGKSLTFFAPSVSVAEAIAVRLGTSLAIDAGFMKVILESDNSGVISRINSKTLNAWESAAVEGDVILLSSPFPFFSFSYVKRECNRAADWLAKACLKGQCPVGWLSSPPDGLLSMLLS